MPRDIPVGNGSLLLNFDKSYNLRDIYWPHVGQALHTDGDISHTGDWVDGRIDISSWANGIKERNNSEGTWRYAEDGVLGRNPIAQGSVDGTLSLHLPDISPGSEAVAYHWLAVGPDLGAVIELETMVCERGPETFLTRTHHYWYRWVNKDEQDFRD